MAVDYATTVAAQNNVAGAPAKFTGAPQVNFSLQGNPTITVTMQQAGLPLFFARIWGSSVASVSASAIAEAYNPAYAQTNTGGFLPPAPKCVKPFLVPNNSQAQPGNPVFVIPATGAVNTAAASFIGETVTLTSACGASAGCNPASAPVAGQYLPMLLPDTHRYCPSVGTQGCTSIAGRFQGSVQCCDGAIFNYGQCGVPATLGSAASMPVATWDQNTNPVLGPNNGQAQAGLQCLIHATTTGPPPPGNPQQDTLNSKANPPLLQIEPGDFSQVRYGVLKRSIMSTSDSIITVPLFDPGSWSKANQQQVTIVGFLQLFVNYAGPTAGPPPLGAANGDMNATILNVIGCGSSLAASSAISGGGASAIPVRLIHN